MAGLFQRTHDALLVALRRAVVDEATRLGEFVKSALDTLNQKPESVDQMGAAAKAWQAIADAKVCIECSEWRGVEGNHGHPIRPL